MLRGLLLRFVNGNMSTIDEILPLFDPISLDRMDKVQLLNRVDTKFMLNEKELIPVLDRMKEDYFMLEADGMRYNRYENLYFDTSDRRMYLQHHNGKLNRFKIRYREYVYSGLCFFEIKFKNNKGRTLKERISVPRISRVISGSQADFLVSHSPYAPELLQPALDVSFSRITLVNRAMTERITIDTGLDFSNGIHEQQIPRLVIAELKHESSKVSSFQSLLHEFHIRDISISKYCLGTATLFPAIKQNNFKPKLLYLKKITHDQPEIHPDRPAAAHAVVPGEGVPSPTV